MGYAASQFGSWKCICGSGFELGRPHGTIDLPRHVPLPDIVGLLYIDNVPDSTRSPPQRRACFKGKYRCCARGGFTRLRLETLTKEGD